MAIQKPAIPKGTRDFSPVEMLRRNYIFDNIKAVYRLFGFNQIETPSIENLSTLMGKYGEEGDKLLFKILNSGNYLRDIEPELLAAGESGKLTAKLCEKGLRYDLTVPFARYVVQHRNDIIFPFKRYQIQPVWRADRPQKGRYREFYQCDADIIGSDSLNNEVELLQIIDDVFCRLGINIAIKLNNRKVLAGIAETIGEPDKIIDITVAIDKIDKIGLEAVNAELAQRGLKPEAIEALKPILQIDGTVAERLEKLSNLLSASEVGTLGVRELNEVIEKTMKLGLSVRLDLDVSLARGLNYYTGTIIEVKALDVEIGSIAGGGRYDNLTGVFGLPGISGVGISFGADRIYDVLLALDKFPDVAGRHTEILFVNFGEKESMRSMEIMKTLRTNGISCELYPEASKLKKQLAYAAATGVKKVAIIGENELEQNIVTVKDLDSSTQVTLSPEQLTDYIKQ